MAGEYLLDTNILIAFFAGEKTVTEKMLAADELFVPITALGELFYGAKRSERSKDNLERIERLLQWCKVLHNDYGTATIYGEMKSQLRTQGRPIPDNDIWIAATARQFGLPLVTRDEHFNEINNLSIEQWK